MSTTAVYHRKIRCPRHFILKAGHDPFIMERNPQLIRIKEEDAKRIGIKLWRRKKDARGQWILNRDSYYQPEMPASQIRETIYDPKIPLCAVCKRCVNK